MYCIFTPGEGCKSTVQRTNDGVQYHKTRCIAFVIPIGREASKLLAAYSLSLSYSQLSVRQYSTHTIDGCSLLCFKYLNRNVYFVSNCGMHSHITCDHLWRMALLGELLPLSRHPLLLYWATFRCIPFSSSTVRPVLCSSAWSNSLLFCLLPCIASLTAISVVSYFRTCSQLISSSCL